MGAALKNLDDFRVPFLDAGAWPDACCWRCRAWIRAAGTARSARIFIMPRGLGRGVSLKESVDHAGHHGKPERRAFGGEERLF